MLSGPAGSGEVWAKPMSDGGAAVVLLNRGDEARDITADDLVPGSAVHDITTGPVDTFDGRLHRRVEPHDAVLLRLP